MAERDGTLKLRVERNECSAACTIGELSIDGAFECYVLEDTVREKEGEPVEAWKVKGETAIPRGTYPVVITQSERFQRPLPLVQNVPGFTGVRIHPGNTSEDTEGCLLVGRGRTAKTVTESKAAFNQLYGKIQQGLQDGDTVTLEIA